MLLLRWVLLLGDCLLWSLELQLLPPGEHDSTRCLLVLFQGGKFWPNQAVVIGPVIDAADGVLAACNAMTAQGSLPWVRCRQHASAFFSGACLAGQYEGGSSSCVCSADAVSLCRTDHTSLCSAAAIVVPTCGCKPGQQPTELHAPAFCCGCCCCICPWAAAAAASLCRRHIASAATVAARQSAAGAGFVPGGVHWSLC